VENLLGDAVDVPEAVNVAGRSLSRDDLWRAGAAVAARIAGAPMVAVHATASLETVVAVVGCLQSGVPFVPVAPDSGPREREHVLRDSGAALVLGTDLAVDVAERAEPGPAVSEGDVTACVLYTSGTTGLPKGVPLTRAGLAADLDALADAWGWTADDVLVHGLPLFHVHGLVLGVLGALRVGSRLVHTGRPDPTAYAAAGGSLYFGVPTVWSRVAADPASARALSAARLLVSGSAALSASTARAMEQLAGQVPVERYGMTETLITLAARHDEERLVGSVGRPLPGVQTRLQDDELQVRAPWLFSGYLNRPEATAEAWTADGWFRTGDTATVDADGRFRIVGRTSVDIIKCGGYKIGAGEVEETLLTHPAVREAAVVGVPDDDLGQRVVAYVVGDGPTDLGDYVAQVLSVHKRPREVHWVEELPRNAMGKVQKTLLRP
jgi:fatty acid CoA ligase FadD36